MKSPEDRLKIDDRDRRLQDDMEKVIDIMLSPYTPGYSEPVWIKSSDCHIEGYYSRTRFLLRNLIEKYRDIGWTVSEEPYQHPVDPSYDGELYKFSWESK